jgi:hypothetical protein
VYLTDLGLLVSGGYRRRIIFFRVTIATQV